MAAKRKKQRNYPIEIIGIFFVFISVLAIGKFGMMGHVFANILRLFVGETYGAIALLLIFLGGYILLNGSHFKFRSKRWFGVILIYLAILIALHLQLFKPIMNSEVNVVAATWRFFLKEFKGISTNQSLGGGMIGAGFYSLSYLLFANIGTYLLMAFFLFVGIMNLGQFSYQHFFRNINFVLKWLSTRLWQGLKIMARWARENVSGMIQHQPNEVSHNSVQNEEESKESIEESPSSNDDIHHVEITGGSILTAEEMAEVAELEIEDEDDSEIKIMDDWEDENENYVLPTTDLLAATKAVDQSGEYATIEKNIKILEKTFASFGVDAKVVKANLGPAVTKYEIQPATGVKVSRIVNLTDDLALALAAEDIRMEAPIPGKSLIGIEVPNSNVNTVYFKDIIEAVSEETSEHLLEVPIGRDISGHVATADLTKMPHLLVAGATGSGKSVAINTIISSILMKAKPHQVRMMLIDPKKVELSAYNGIPHLLTPVVTHPKKAARALQNVVAQMEERYELFSKTGTKNLESYNQYLKRLRAKGEETPPLLPYIVVIVDELADLMMVASKEVEDAIIRLAQMARAAGIHMILATQRPSVDVITGLIKANVPSRMAFAVSSGTDSRTILDTNGAEKLLGRGDMLFEPMGASRPERIQGAFISEADVQTITDFVKSQQDASYVEHMIPKEPEQQNAADEKDEYFEEAVALVQSMETASISLLQRRFRMGYNRAARLMDDLEAHHIVGPQEGPKPREVLIDENFLEKRKENHSELE
ncbi:FtsK/SpoIIIE family DNA translocase [Allofustis seminis]|uniref:FtsK/SpoIIIE family DNA translocase n=1 Tax=Allofustis seminis TaxID=166939 RepID=UPI000361950E|nr:DNA translocase FtsK [Allofustis seminis]